MIPLGTGDPVALGPYRLLGVLSAEAKSSADGTNSGLGRVYLGQDDFGGTAAVRLIGSTLAADRCYVERALREAELARGVLTAGVARILETGEVDGRPWIAAEFLAGPTLTEAVTAFGPLPVPAVRVLAASLARTLDDIHAAGLVHHDLNPSNIVLTSAGPHLVGVGIARPDRALALNATGGLATTPEYAAPESVLGQSAGPAADLYSLGAVLAYAASGRHAFAPARTLGPEAPADPHHATATLHQIVHGEPELADVPPNLRAVLTPCLAKDPAARPSLAQLEKFAAPPLGAESTWLQGPLGEHIVQRERSGHEPTTVVSTPSGTGTDGMSRRRLLTLLAAGGAVAAAGGGAFWWLRAREAKEGFALPPAARTPVARARKMPEYSDLDGLAAKRLWGPLKVVSEDSHPPLPVRDVIVFGAKGGGISAHSVTDGKRRWTAPKAAETAGYLSLSDALIATADQKGTLRTYVAATGTPRWTAPAEARLLLAADDEAVYVVTKSGRLRSISRSDAAIRWTVRAPADLRTKRPALAAHGRLVLTTAAGDVFVLDTANGRKVWDLPNQSPADTTIRPALADDTVYLNGRTMTARRITDGKELWTVRVGPPRGTDGLAIWGKPTIHENAVYATQGIETCALDLRDGGQLWSNQALDSDGSPVLPQGRGVWHMKADQYEMEGAVGVVLAVNRKGLSEERWQFPLKDEGGNHWLMADGNRVFVLDGQELTALPVF